MGYYTIKKGKDDQFYWNLKAANHEIICQSEGYTTKQGAEKGIESVRHNADSDVIKDETQQAA